VPERRAPRRGRLTFALATVLAVHAVAIPLMLRLGFGTPRPDTIVGHVERLVHRQQAADSWRPMAAAQAFADANPGRDIYEEIFFRRKVKFQYAPTSLLYVRHLPRATLNVLSWAAVWMTIVLTVLIFRDAHAGNAPAMRASLVVAGLAATFYPLLKGYTLGQIQVWVDALFACSVWAWLRGLKRTAGVALGLACLIKPPLVPLALWAMIRREWRLAAGFATTFAVGVAVSVAIYGLASHLSYVRVLSYIAERGEAYYPNQSFNGLLNRWYSNGSNLEFDDHAFSPPHPIVAIGTTASALALYSLALLLPARIPSRDRRFDLAIITLTATMASPIAWEHHYGVLLPVFALVVPAALDQRPLGRWTAALLVASFLLTAQYVQPVQRLASTPVNPLQSYVLLGAVFLLILACAGVLRSTEGPGTSATDGQRPRAQPSA
jgi:alpha-1,2-mannosyltransferase